LALAEWARLLAMGRVAHLFGVSWQAVYAAVRRVVAYGLSCRDKTEAFIVGIDEISRRRRHVYHTQVYDLIKRTLLASVPGQMESQLRPMQEFASLLRRHRDGVLAHFELPIDNGLVEAMNASAKAISMRAGGYRSPVFFSTLLLHCLGGLKMPTFVHRFA
jgi:transposase